MPTDEIPPLRSHMKEKLARGETVFSMTARMVRTVDIASIAYAAGFDSIYIDFEHSSFPLEAAGQICLAAQHLGVTPLVRVPSLDPAFIARVMDSGAMGVVIPGVDSAAEARTAVAAVKHAPLGERSLAGAAPQLHYRALPPDRVIRELDAASVIVAQIETLEGLAAAEEIAAVEGVDVLLVGANDLTLAMGIAGSMDDPRLDEAYLQVIDACLKHHKAAGVGGLGSRPDLIRKYLDRGATYVSTGNDNSFLSAAATQKRRQFDRPENA